MKNYTLHRVNPLSLLKIGFLIGFVASCLPVTLFSYAFIATVSAIAEWLGGMVYRLKLPLLGDFGIDINVVELLHLENFYDQVSSWAALGGLQLIFLVVFFTLLCALFWGLVAALSGLLFNLLSKAAGGVQVSMTDDSVAEIE